MKIKKTKFKGLIILNGIKHQDKRGYLRELVLEKLINQLNLDKNIDGMLLQLPIPKKFDEQKLISHINPSKDVDGLNEVNIGKLVKNEPAMRSCTPAGIINLLRSQNITIEGKKIVVVGRSLLVGKPLSLMLLNLNGTITMTHSKTINLDKVCKEADILIAAAGKPNLVDSNVFCRNTKNFKKWII